MQNFSFEGFRFESSVDPVPPRSLRVLRGSWRLEKWVDGAIQWSRMFFEPSIGFMPWAIFTPSAALSKWKLHSPCRTRQATACKSEENQVGARSKSASSLFVRHLQCAHMQSHRGCTSCAPSEIFRHAAPVSNYQPLSSNQGIARINLHKNVNQCCSREYQEQAASHIRHCSLRHIIAENRSTSHCNPCSSRMPQYRT